MLRQRVLSTKQIGISHDRRIFEVTLEQFGWSGRLMKLRIVVKQTDEEYWLRRLEEPYEMDGLISDYSDEPWR